MAKTWSGKEVIRILMREFGFVIASQKGSHMKLKKRAAHGALITIVPLHPELATGTLRSALESAGIDFETFKRVAQGWCSRVSCYANTRPSPKSRLSRTLARTMPTLCLSGIQPTNVTHIGNYIGALKQWLDVQHKYPCLFCVVDLHAITVPQDPKALRENIRMAAATYLATGIDPARSHIFIQSEVPEHAELGWILTTITKIAELERMTQYKDKAKKRGENVGAGLFTYPALMAADILLYDTSVVPVGEDQVQHLELTRLIARRFNTEFGDTFAMPQALIQKTGARIMALDDATSKMSKSASSAASYIALTDTDDVIRKKISKAVTDSGSEIVYDPHTRPALANLLTIFHHMTGTKIPDIEKQFTGKGYGDFKKALAEATITHLAPIRARINEYLSDKGALDRVLDAGRDAAREIATKKMQDVRKKVGLGR